MKLIARFENGDDGVTRVAICDGPSVLALFAILTSAHPDVMSELVRHATALRDSVRLTTEERHAPRPRLRVLRRPRERMGTPHQEGPPADG